MDSCIARCARHVHPVHLALFLILLAACMLSQRAVAEPLKSAELLPNHGLAGLKEYRFNKQLKMRGWRLTPGMYLGQAKVAGKWGPGLVLDRGSHAYAINHRSISFSIRF